MPPVPQPQRSPAASGRPRARGARPPAGDVVRGRPRSTSADEAILRAALRLLQDEGYLRISIDQIAEAAGVGRATVYRRYRTKADVVASAVAAGHGFADPVDTGRAYDDLLALLRQAQDKYESAAGMPLAGVLLTDGPHNPELLAVFRQRILGPRRARYEDVLRRGIERGEVRQDLDVEGAIDALSGSYYAHYLSGRPIGRDWPEQTLGVLWPAFAAAPPQAETAPAG